MSITDSILIPQRNTEVLVSNSPIQVLFCLIRLAIKVKRKPKSVTRNLICLFEEAKSVIDDANYLFHHTNNVFGDANSDKKSFNIL